MSPPAYNDEDLVDYENDYYSDEEMNSEEEEELLLSVAQVRSLLDTITVTDDEIKDSIYHYDFDTDKVVKYFKDRAEKLKKKLAEAKAKEEKLKVEAESKAKIAAAASTSKSKLQDLADNKSLSGLQPTSKLAALAKAKSGNLGSNNSLNSIGLLSKISTGKGQGILGTRESASPSTVSTEPSSATKLSSLKSKLTSAKLSSSKSPSSPSSALSKLQSQKLPSKLSGVKLGQTTTKEPNQQINPLQPTSPIKKKNFKPIKCFPDIDLDILNLPVQKLPNLTSIGMIFGVSRYPVYKLNGVSNTLLDSDSIEVINAFNKPSPDDIILSAQEQGFSIDKKIGTLKLNDEAPLTPSQSPTPKSSGYSTPLKIDINNELIQNKKPCLNFVVIGHVDAGKSTLMGRLLYDVGAVDKHIIDKYTKESTNIGKSSFALAWVMDQTEEERNRGVTIDICISTFNTKNVQFTIVDAPGHRDFVPNMIAGSSQADVAVLVVDSATNAFESGFNLDGQTKEHAILVRSLGVDRIIVAINKLDTVDWSFTRYEEIRIQLTEFLTKIVGFQLQKITFIPVSGLNGDNVVNTKSLSWYKGESILSQLEKVAIEEKPISQKKDHEKDFRMIISDSYQIPHSSEIAIQGRIDSGSVQVGQIMKVNPSSIAIQVKSISINGEGTSAKQNWAIAGDNVILNISSSNLTVDQINVGDVVTNDFSHIESVNKFISRIVVFDLKRPILPGSKMILHRGRTNEPCKVKKLIATLDKATGHEIKKKPRFLSSGQTATIEIELENEKTIPMDIFSNSKELGRFVLRKDGSTIAAGVVDSLYLPQPVIAPPEQ